MKLGEGRRHRSVRITLLVVIAAGVLISFSLPEELQAKVINVPADQPTIQAAIDAAANGDTVQVAPGTYNENVNFNGKAITVTSTAGPQTTIIDGGQHGGVVTFNSGEGLSSVLSGFTIQNGYANMYVTDSDTNDGGGILISNTSPKITNNIIENNQACDGAGVAIFGGSPLLQGNTITHNMQGGCGGGSGGGGIIINGPGAAQIIGNTISNNTIDSSWGGGISLFGNSTPTIEDNLITGNTANESGGGIASVDNFGAEIVQNVIVGNTAANGGGGIYVSVSNQPSNFILINNTIADNVSSGAGSQVLLSGFDAQVQVINNVVEANSIETAFLCDASYSSTPPIVTFNDVFNSSGGTAYDGSCAGDSGMNGNISADPLFFDPANNNFRIQPNSPVIDTGSNSAHGLPSTDFDGNPRIHNGTVDMGAYEFFPATMSLSATSFTFGPTAFGTSSPAQTLTVTNTGSTKLLLDISVTNGFSETNNCGSVVAPGANCKIFVTFVPHARGTNTGALVLVSNATSNPNSISLTGTGLAALLSLFPTGLSFGNQLQGTTSAAQTVTITNLGDIPLTFFGIATSGDFAQTNTCSQPVAVGSSCTISVTFTPPAVGQSIGSLTLTDNAPGAPQTVTLTGTGVIYAIPQIDLPLSPDSATPGGVAFTLTVNGSGFAPASVVNWNGSPRPTAFVSATQLMAQISASDISNAGNALVTVVNPSPGGGTSNAVTFQIATAIVAPVWVRSDIAVGKDPQFVAEADFNGDGKPDLAVANAGSNTVSILLGKGGGTFQPRVDYATGLEPGAITVGDFNKDGKLDLAIANTSCPIAGGICSYGTISILLGNGDGTFQPQKTIYVNYVPLSIVTGDFNHDGILDLAIGQSAPGGGVVTIFLGNGDGTFRSGINDPAGPHQPGIPPSLVTGDFNRDGNLDLALTSGYSGSTISILLGNGDGTFKSPVEYATGLQPQTIVSGDFNGDGKLDVAVTDHGTNAVSVLLGNGDGTFQSGVEYPTGIGTFGLTAADLSGDGRLDLITTNWNANTISVLTGNGDGTFQANQDIPAGVGPRSVVAADFKGDGLLDLATANSGSNTVSILLQVPSTTATVSSNSLEFGDQDAGTTSSAQTVTLTNTGSAQLYVDAIHMAGDFAQTNTCGNPVAPGASCTISVTFTPLALGSRTGTLTIIDNAGGNPQIVSLNGSGTGIGFDQIAGALSHISVGSDGTVWGINSAGEIWMFNPQTQNWQQAPGALTQIAVGANGSIWGLNSASQIFRYDAGTQNWDSIPGSLSQIAVGADGDVWGINSAQQIWHFNTQKQNWDAIPGSLAQITVGYDGAVWGINSAQQIFRFNPGIQNWQQVPGSLSQIAVGADGDVWGINSASQIFHFNTLTQNWDNIPGTLAQIAVGSGGNIWGINAQNQIFEYNSQMQGWVNIPGVLTQIAVGANGAVWGLNANNGDAIYQFVQPTQPAQTLHQLPGQLAQVAVGIDDNVWGINSAQQIWHFNTLTQNWDNVPGALTQIAVGFGGNVWGINAAGQIWRFNAQAQNWEQIPGELAQIAVGANGDVWGINSAHQIFRFSPSVQNGEQLPGLLAQLSVGADGTVWGINSAQQIFRFDAQTQNWDEIPGSLLQIAVGSANQVWGINEAGEIWRYDPAIQSWDSIPGSLKQIAVGYEGAVWGVNSANQVWRFNEQTQDWDSISGSLTQMSVPADAIAWGVDANGQIYFFR